jgi:large subunit ribosomal protein L4
MPTIDIKDWNNKKVGSVELPDEIFAYPYKEHLIHEAVRNYLASLRQGTHKTKTRSEVAGSGKKPFRQKGTGRARQGGNRPPIHRHGGTVFGPQPRDYSYKMPKKAWRRALTLAIADRAANGKMLVVEALELAEAKTKLAKAALAAMGAQHALIVVGEGDENFARAARNLADHKVLALAGLNVYDVLNYDELLMTAKTAKAIEARLGGAQ